MNQFTMDVLRKLHELSKPYVDITELESDYDIRSQYFIAAFRYLELHGYIASANTQGCGLGVGSDGLASWSVVDLYVTDSGINVLNPPGPEREKASSWLVKPAIVTLVCAAIVAIVGFLFWPYVEKKLEPYQLKHQEPESTLNKSNQQGPSAGTP